MKHTYFYLLVFSLLITNIASYSQSKDENRISHKDIANKIKSNLIHVDGGLLNYGPPIENNIERHITRINPFLMSKFEITQEEFNALMGRDYNPYRNNTKSYKGNNYPAYVNIEDCLLFIAKLNEISKESYRLPNNEEWEFAAKGGILSHGYKYSGGNDPNSVGWTYNNTGNARVHEVGKKKSNELGLYDMTGNEDEWCIDIKDKNIFHHRGGNIGSVSGFEVWCQDGNYRKNQDWIKCGFRIVLDCRSEDISNTQNSSSSGNDIIKNNKDNNLLYKGIYTISSQGRSQTTGGYTGYAGSDFETEIEIYDDYIIVSGSKCKFSRVSGNERVYFDPGFSFGGTSTSSSYYIDSNYNLRKIDTFSSQYGTDWFEYEVSKGRCTMPKYQPQFINTPSYNNSRNESLTEGKTGVNESKSKANSRKACSSCKYTNGKCPVCKGAGKQHSSAAGVNTRTTCRNCNGSGKCPVCGGDGWIN